MSIFRSFALAVVLIAACKQNTQTESDRSADRVVGLAHDDFAIERTIRIETLQATHAIIAAQRPMIGSLADALPLTEQGKEQVKEKLDVLQLRLDATGNLIEGLRHVGTAAWKDRESQVEDAMKSLDDARHDAWKAVEDAPRKDLSS